MSDSSEPQVAACCYCGAVALHLAAPATSVVHCHCRQCRQLSGAAFTTWVSFPKLAVHLLGEENLVAFSATPKVMRHFCKICGSHVFTADERIPTVLGVPAGIIKGQLSQAPTAHYFVSHAPTWHSISDALPQFGGESGIEPNVA